MQRRYWPWLTLALLTISTPFLLFPGGWRTLALLILPLAYIGNRLITGHFVHRTPYDLAIFLLLVMVLVSLYATFDIQTSLPKITGVLLGVSIMYGLVNFATSAQRLKLVTLGVMGIIAAFIALVMVGTDWGTKIPLVRQISGRLPMLLQGLPGAAEGFHPAEVGGTLTWIIFLPTTAAIGLCSYKLSFRRALVVLVLFGLTATMILVLLFTQSRSTWISVAVGICALLFLSGRWGKLILGLGLIIVLATTLVIGPTKILEQITENPEPELGTVFTPNLEGRVEIWSRAIYGIQDFPFTGMGMNTFRHIVRILYPLFLISPDMDIAHAHNESLQAALDLGIPGLVAFLALQGMALYLAYCVFRSDAPTSARWTAAGALLGLIAHSVYGLTDAVALGAKPGIFFWILLGLVANLYQQHHSASKHS